MTTIQSLREQLKAIDLPETTIIVEGVDNSDTLTEGKVTSALTAAMLAVLSSHASAGVLDTDKLSELAAKLASTAADYAGEAKAKIGDAALDASRRAAGVTTFSAAIADVKRAITGESIFVEIFNNSKVAASNLATLIKTSTVAVIDVIKTYSVRATEAEDKLFQTKYNVYYTEAVFKKKFNDASDAIDSALMKSEEYAKLENSKTIAELKSAADGYIKKWISLVDSHMAANITAK